MLSEHLITISQAEYESMQMQIIKLQSDVDTLEARLHGLADNVPGMIYQFGLNPDGTMQNIYLYSNTKILL